ncbi:ribonuclease H-like domain-containing protein, partial [Tanacetum coccineum]
MYENFSASSHESLDSISNMLQKIVSQLAILDLGTISFDDLYNNFKIVEQEVKRSVTSSSNSSSQNVAFVSTPGSSNEDNTANIHVNTASTNDSAAILKSFIRELVFDGACFDWSFMVDEEVPTNLALMAFSDSKVNNHKTCSDTCLKSYETLKYQYDSLRVEFNKSEFDLATYKRGLASVEEQLVFYKKNEVMLCDQIAVLKRDASFKDSEINALNIQIEKLKKEKESNQIKIDNFENASKNLDKLIGSQISDNNRKGVGYNAVPPPPTGLFAPPTIDLSSSGLKEFQQPEFEGYGVNVNKSVSENSSNEKTTGAPIIKDWVSDCDEDESEAMESVNVQHKSEPKPEQAKQPRKISENPRNDRTNWNKKKTQKLGVGFQFTKKACFVCGSFNHLIKDCDFHDKKMVQKPVMNNVQKGTGQREVRLVWNNALRNNHQNFSNSRRNFAPTTVLTKSGIVPISTARQRSPSAAAPLSAARPINTTAPKLFVNVAKTKPNVFQKAHSLSKRPFDQQTSLNNRSLNNKVNTAKVNSINTAKGKRNVVPSKGLTCLIAKATNDESNMWHRRLGHINFKTMNKLVKGNLVRGIENQLEHKVKIIRCENGTKFKNYDMNQLCGIKGIKREFITILNTLDHLGKFDGKADEEFLVGYSINSKDFRVFNSITRKVEENLHVNFLENKPNVVGSGPEWLFDIDTLTNSMNYQPISAGNRTNGNAGLETNSDAGQARKENVPDQEYILLPLLHTSSNVPSNSEESSPKDDAGKKNEVKDSAKEGNMNGPGEATNTDSTNRLNTVSSPVNTDTVDLQDTGIFGSAYDDEYVGAEADLSNLETNMSMEPKKVTRALDDESWVEAMQEELLQFKLLNVWTLVDLPHEKKVIGTKWVLETREIKEMDVKSAFLYGTIEEEVYVNQPLGFVDPEFPNRVYKVEKALYGLHQAPRAWESLSTEFEQLMHKRFQMSSMGELTFFLGLQVKQRKDGIFLNQDKYVYDILKKFGFSSVKTKVLWLQNQLLNCGYNFMKKKIHVDNESAICVVKKPVYHSKTKHIEIRHHFIRDSYEKKLIEMMKIHANYNVADLLTKAFDVTRLSKIDCLLSSEVLFEGRLMMSIIHSSMVGNEAVHNELGDRMERAATTASILEAEHDS